MKSRSSQRLRGSASRKTRLFGRVFPPLVPLIAIIAVSSPAQADPAPTPSVVELFRDQAKVTHTFRPAVRSAKVAVSLTTRVTSEAAAEAAAVAASFEAVGNDDTAAEVDVTWKLPESLDKPVRFEVMARGRKPPLSRLAYRTRAAWWTPRYQLALSSTDSCSGTPLHGALQRFASIWNGTPYSWADAQTELKLEGTPAIQFGLSTTIALGKQQRAVMPISKPVFARVPFWTDVSTLAATKSSPLARVVDLSKTADWPRDGAYEIIDQAEVVAALDGPGLPKTTYALATADPATTLKKRIEEDHLLKEISTGKLDYLRVVDTYIDVETKSPFTRSIDLAVPVKKGRTLDRAWATRDGVNWARCALSNSTDKQHYVYATDVQASGGRSKSYLQVREWVEPDAPLVLTLDPLASQSAVEARSRFVSSILGKLAKPPNDRTDVERAHHSSHVLLVDVGQQLEDLARILKPSADEDERLVRARIRLRYPADDSPYAAVQWSHEVDQNRNRRAEIADQRAALIRHYNEWVMRLGH